VICQRCDVDYPIECFAFKAAKRRDRYCCHCHAAAAQRRADWHAHGRPCSRCGLLTPCPDEITDYPRDPAVCTTCRKAKERDRQREWTRTKRATDPDFRHRANAASIRWQKRNPVYVWEAGRARYLRTVSDPQRYQRLLEDARMRYRLRKERKGEQIRVISEAVYLRRYGHGHRDVERVPAGPLRRELERSEMDLNTIAARSGLSTSYVLRVLTGQYEQLALRDADRLAIGVGSALAILYPQDEAA
jgi:hypothetical protein